MTSTIRAIAENNELEVSFGKGTASVQGNNIQIPLPSLGCSADDLDATRGVGDEIALKMRYHDEGVHRHNTPSSGPAQELFQWVEDARVASIGTLRMEGVAQNLDATLDSLCKQAAFDQITAQTEAPLGIAVGLIVRQRLTGRPLPSSAENVAQFWRDYVESNAGKHIDDLQLALHDQREFAKRCREILHDLGLSTELIDPPELQENEQDMESLNEEEEPDAEFLPEDVVLDDDSLDDEESDGETAAMEMDADMDMSESEGELEQEEAPLSPDWRRWENSCRHRLQAVHH